MTLGVSTRPYRGPVCPAEPPGVAVFSLQRCYAGNNRARMRPAQSKRAAARIGNYNSRAGRGSGVTAQRKKKPRSSAPGFR